MIHNTLTDPNGVRHRWVISFETIFFNQNHYEYIQNFMSNWWWICFPYAFLYITLVFVGKKIMEKRQNNFQLRRALFLWNASLALFSLWGSCRSIPELIHIFSNHGLRQTVCDSSYKEGITGLWFVCRVKFFRSAFCLFLLIGLGYLWFQKPQKRSIPYS